MTTNKIDLAFLVESGKKNPGMTPEEFIQALNEAKMTPEERKLAAAEKAGRVFGVVIASVIILLLVPTVIWAALTFLVGVSVSWVKVFGAYFIFNFLKNLVVNQVKGN